MKGKYKSLLWVGSLLLLQGSATAETNSLFEDKEICRGTCQACPTDSSLMLESGMRAIQMDWRVPDDLPPKVGALMNIYEAGALGNPDYLEPIAKERRVIGCTKGESLVLEVTPQEALKIHQAKQRRGVLLKYSFLDNKVPKD